MKIIDLKDAPGMSGSVTNGMTSVSDGDCFIGKDGTPHCRWHGAINKVSPEGIWRCINCSEFTKNSVGCWEAK